MFKITKKNLGLFTSRLTSSLHFGDIASRGFSSTLICNEDEFDRIICLQGSIIFDFRKMKKQFLACKKKKEKKKLVNRKKKEELIEKTAN